MFFVYIIYSQKIDRFYIGSSQDVSQRLEWHNNALFQNAFSKRGIPWILFFVLECDSKSQALKIEQHIKKMKSRKYIADLKKYPPISEKLKSTFA